MKTVVTVEAGKLVAFHQALAVTGWRPTGRMRRLGRAADGTPVRDIEIQVPPDRRGSRADLGALPGVRRSSCMGGAAAPAPRRRAAIADSLFSRLSWSGRRAR